MKREIHLPHTYKHFKGSKYITLFTATYIGRKEHNEQLFEGCMEATHTEYGDCLLYTSPSPRDRG